MVIMASSQEWPYEAVMMWRAGIIETPHVRRQSIFFVDFYHQPVLRQECVQLLFTFRRYGFPLVDERSVSFVPCACRNRVKEFG